MLTATVTFLRTEDGGRHTPVRSGYRGQFFFDGEDFESAMEVLPERWVQPGETTEVGFAFTENSIDRLRARIGIGQAFKLREGSRVVANGIVTGIDMKVDEFAELGRRLRAWAGPSTVGLQSDAHRICFRLSELIPNVKRGSLRIWGQWFGTPMDNVHRIVRCEVEDNSLRVFFNQDEVLTVDNPRGFCVCQDQFWIDKADRVLWEWFYYGRLHSPVNLYREEFVNNGGAISATSTVDWYDVKLRPSIEHRAVEIL